eukprot:CCRYP_019120-RA/>CCRYP_019120-RA protein AED:0.56 eAED:0.38 QI:0/-1/0/1/-1/0/1/0/98
MYQDNKFTILLANDGSWLSSERTKHIKSSFFIKDKVQSGEVSVEHRQTNRMWSDVLTKPKQGAGFHQDRSMFYAKIQGKCFSEGIAKTLVHRIAISVE